MQRRFPALSRVTKPIPHVVEVAADEVGGEDGDANPARVVAVQVAFESKGLKPVSRLTGPMVETRRFQAMGQLHSSCAAPPGTPAAWPCCSGTS